MQEDLKTLKHDINSLIIKSKNHDSDSTEMILKMFKPKVIAICREYFLTGADFDDLLQEGMIGLYKAIQNYDNTKNDNFSSFATMCIHRQIQSAVKIANSNKNKPLNEYFSINTTGVIENDAENPLQIVLVTKDRVVEKISLAKEKSSSLYNKIKEVLNEEQFKILMLYLNGYSYGEIAIKSNLCSSKDVPTSALKKVDNTIQSIKRKLKNIKID